MAEKTFQENVKLHMEKANNMKDEDKLYKYNGIFYSTILSPPETLEAMKSFEAREEDIMVVAYPKSGFNWMVGIMRKITTACGITLPQRPPLIEFHPPEAQKAVGELKTRRFFGTHMHPDNIPESFKNKKTKMLVIFRNPKDTVVSYYHFMNKNPVLPKTDSWEKFFSDFMSGEVPWGSYFDHAVAWEKHFDDPAVMLLTYEELKENLQEGVKRVAEFFSFLLTEEQIKAIAEASTFKAMLESSKSSHGGFGSVFFRKGEVGDWRNHFSEAQSKEMDEEFKKKLAGTKLGVKLKYDVYCQ